VASFLLLIFQLATAPRGVSGVVSLMVITGFLPYLYISPAHGKR